MNESGLTVGNDAFRVVLVPDPDTGRQGLQVEVADAGSWRAVTAGANPLVRGKSFNLLADEVQLLDSQSLRLSGSGVGQGRSGKIHYAWSGRIVLEATTGWMRVEAILELPEELELQMVGGFEPEITLDLGPLPPYERGDHVWFKTLIANPTKWNDEAFGNDMPATYYCDPNGHYELMMFFDMTLMDWMGFDNIARFMNYRCGWRRRYRPEPASEIGLYADGYSGLHLRAGQIKFAYALRAAARPKPPTDQAALNELVSQALTLLPTDTAWPAGATSWDAFAQGCLADLNHPDCWRKDSRGEFILNYVNGQSPAWNEAIAARGQVCDMLHPCLDSALWLLRPLEVLRKLAPTRDNAAFIARLWAMLDWMLESDGIPLLCPATQLEVHGCWQYCYMLAELWHAARSAQRTEVMHRVVAEIERTMLPLARRCQYVFPLSFDRYTLEKSGSGDGHSIAGLYAELMLDLYDAYGTVEYRSEAELALRTLYHLPVNSVNQEVFLTAHGAHAALRLTRESGEPFWARCAEYLRAQTLRMLYWFNDRTTEETRYVNSLGTFQACCSIIYSAVFENIEVLARLAPSLAGEASPEPLLRVYNLARKNNFYYFPECLPAQWHSSGLKFIPHENIPILEGPEPGKVGQEIYGAGWTFRAHLLWDAWGRVADRDLMLLNVNAYEEEGVLAGDHPVLFLVYNPTHETRAAEIVLTLPAGWDSPHWNVEASNTTAPQGMAGVGVNMALTLGPGGWARLKVVHG